MSVVALVLAGSLALSAPAAIAQTSPTQAAYGGVIAEVVTPSKPSKSTPPAQKAVPTQTAAVQATPAQSALPFTGFQAVLVLLAGAALLGTGLVLRRVTTGRND
jgi:hypothetical protein